MSVTPQTQAVLLLTVYFSKPGKGDPRPLTPKEWGRFALWLKERTFSPESLMTGDIKVLLEGWSDKAISYERIEQLMNRGSALALAMEKWMRAGLWVLTRSDADYPSRLKQKLRTDSPAVLFGCGNVKLLNHGGIAVVGARNASDEDLTFTRKLAAKTANEGFSIVSGGARGVDEASMLGALEAEGTVVGVLADSLLRAATSNKYRKYLLNKNLVLISPFYPEAGFNAGNAMARNKYIYCLSDAAVVVQSGKKGGTWSGAIENLKKVWVPLWVRPTNDRESGNNNIVNQGGNWLPDLMEDIDFSVLKFKNEGMKRPSEPQDLFSQSQINEDQSVYEVEASMDVVAEKENATSNNEVGSEQEDNNPDKHKELEIDISSLGFYELFLLKLRELTEAQSKTVEELIEFLDINKTQVNAWLKQAVSDKKVTKMSKPVRYQWTTGKTIQKGIFED